MPEENLTDFAKEGNEKKKPVETDWIPLGENYGINIAVWETGVSIQKRKKNEDGTWETTESFNLSHAVLEKLFVRIPTYWQKTKKEFKKNE